MPGLLHVGARLEAERGECLIIGKRFVDMQRIWATVGKAAGVEVPYAGNIAPVTGLFSNVG